MGRYDFAALGTLGVLSANLILRPIANLVNRAPEQTGDHEILYRLRCICRPAHEANVRAKLMQAAGRTPLTLVALHSNDDEVLSRVNVRAYLKTIGPKEQAIEQIVVRLSLEAGVTSIAWEIAASVDPGDVTISTNGDVVHAA